MRLSPFHVGISAAIMQKTGQQTSHEMLESPLFSMSAKRLSPPPYNMNALSSSKHRNFEASSNKRRTESTVIPWDFFEKCDTHISSRSESDFATYKGFIDKENKAQFCLNKLLLQSADINKAQISSHEIPPIMWSAYSQSNILFNFWSHNISSPAQIEWNFSAFPFCYYA